MTLLLDHAAIWLPCAFMLIAIWLTLRTYEERMRRHALAAVRARAAAQAEAQQAYGCEQRATAALRLAAEQLKELEHRAHLDGPRTVRGVEMDVCGSEPQSGVILNFPVPR